MKFFKLSLIISVFSLFIFACNETANNNKVTNNTSNNTVSVVNTNNQTTAPKDEMAVGKSAYKESCAQCHKDDGTGGKVTIEGRTMKPDNLTTDKMKNLTDEKYIKLIENGIPDEGMPAYKGKLTDAQMQAIVKYIRTEIQAK